MKPLAAGCLFAAAGLFAASSALAQLVPLSRCNSAYPCAIPFGLQYRPDPLITGQYGRVSNTAMVATVSLEPPFAPKIAVRTAPDRRAIDEAVRQFLATHPPKTTSRKAPPSQLRSGG